MKGSEAGDPIRTLPEFNEYLEDMYQSGDRHRQNVHFINSFKMAMGGEDGLRAYVDMWFDHRRTVKPKPGVMQPDFSLEEIEQAKAIIGPT